MFLKSHLYDRHTNIKIFSCVKLWRHFSPQRTLANIVPFTVSRFIVRCYSSGITVYWFSCRFALSVRRAAQTHSTGFQDTPSIVRTRRKMLSAGIRISRTCGASRFHNPGIGTSFPGFVGIPKQNWCALWLGPSFLSDLLILQVKGLNLLGNTRRIDDLQVSINIYGGILHQRRKNKIG